jgi:VWFA-related protein
MARHRPRASDDRARSSRRPTAVVAPLLLVGGLSLPSDRSPAPGQPHFRGETTAVVVAVSVEDGLGRPVAGLEREHFEVFEDGEPRPITYFEGQGEPGAILVLLDRSSSMTGAPLAEAKRSTNELVDATVEGSEIGLAAFDSDLELIQPFTRDRSPVRAALDSLDARGGTALYDALLGALGLLADAESRRQAIVVLSDGADLDSRSAFTDVVDEVGTSGVVFYAVGVYDDAERRRYMDAGQYFREPAFPANLNPVWVLGDLARRTGGLAFFPERHESLASRFVAVAADQRQQYVIGYAASSEGAPRMRSIEVRVNRRGDSRAVRVRTRSGLRY